MYEIYPTKTKEYYFFKSNSEPPLIGKSKGPGSERAQSFFTSIKDKQELKDLETNRELVLQLCGNIEVLDMTQLGK
jgi:hypothetical protein